MAHQQYFADLVVDERLDAALHAPDAEAHCAGAAAIGAALGALALAPTAAQWRRAYPRPAHAVVTDGARASDARLDGGARAGHVLL